MEQRDHASSSSASVTGDNRNAEAEVEAEAEAEASSSGNRESDPAAASVSSPFDTRVEGVGEEEGDGRGGRFNYDFRHPEIIVEESQQEQEQERQNFFGIPYRGNFFVFDDSSAVRDDSWSCIIVVLTFWFFVSMTLILGVYGPESLSLGPYSSVLIEPNPIFVQSIRVEGLDDTVDPGLVLYGLYESPSLDVAKTWSTSHNASVPYDSHKEWIYFLNEGSQINITYNLSSASSSVFLVIAEGNDGLKQWLDDPTYPNTTLSWNVIRGSGTVEQHIYTSTSYYIAVGNLNSDDIEVHLDLSVRSYLYDTSEAYYKCSIADGACGLSILFPTGNSVVLTSPGLEVASPNNQWDVTVSYGPRWTIYIVGVAGMTVLMLAAFSFLNNFRCYCGEESGVNYRGAESERAPLLQYKDDDLSSWGSSCDSVSSDEKDIEEFLAANGIEGKPSRDGENGNNTRRLCAICYDAPRDCFFLPCGHCVACFECGTRIAEVAGTCPVCRRDMKKNQRIDDLLSTLSCIKCSVVFDPHDRRRPPVLGVPRTRRLTERRGEPDPWVSRVEFDAKPYAAAIQRSTRSELAADLQFAPPAAVSCCGFDSSSFLKLGFGELRFCLD